MRAGVAAVSENPQKAAHEERRRRVLELSAKGLDTEQIAARLGLGKSTVRTILRGGRVRDRKRGGADSPGRSPLGAVENPNGAEPCPP